MSSRPRTRIIIVVSLMLQVLLMGYGTIHAEPDPAKTYIIGEVSNIPSAPAPTAATPAATAAATPAASNVTTNGVYLDRRLSLHAALEKLGYVEGKNVTYLFDPAAWTGDKLDNAAKKMVEAKPDILIAYGTGAAVSIKKAAAGTSIPIVFVGTLNPVEAGVVSSLQNTEGNVTGVGGSSNAYAKQLEWLVRINPKLKRVYIPVGVPDPSNAVLAAAAVSAVKDYAAKTGIEVLTPTIATTNDVAPAIANLPQVDAIMLVGSAPGLVDFFQAGIKLKIPTTSSFPNLMDSGVFLSYNYTEDTVGAEAARYVDRIFRGAKPSDLPVSIANNSLAVNLKTAQAIGLNIPNDILQQAAIIVR